MLEINAAFLGQVQSDFCRFLANFTVLGEVVSEPLSKEQMESGEGLAQVPRSNSLQVVTLLTTFSISFFFCSSLTVVFKIVQLFQQHNTLCNKQLYCHTGQKKSVI